MIRITQNLFTMTAISVSVLSILPANANDGNLMVNQQSGVIVGYWHNWCDGAGYKGGKAPCVSLKQVNSQYNVVNVSFMKVFDVAEGRIPTFRLDPNIGLSEQAFINEISELNRQGRSVLLALGGADAHIELQQGDEHAFADEIIRLTDKFGFDGLDIDLEQAAVTAADNQTVIPAALRLVKDHYKAQGKNFLITMAPEFPYLRQGGKYIPYITALAGYYDWINPQFYNQGGDGVFVDGVGWVAQTNESLKQEFIYYMADSLANGTRGFHKIPNDKLVFGIPANMDAAASGFIQNPETLYSAFNQLTQQGQPLKGVMTWSINWDMGASAAGAMYNNTFIKNYGPFIHGQIIEPPKNAPVLSGITDARVRQGASFDELANVSAIDKEDNNLTSSIVVTGSVDTSTLGQYILVYTVKDSAGNESKESRKVEVFSDKPLFSGVNNVKLALGSTFDPMAGVTANDTEDGDLTANVSVSGRVDNSRVGQYTLTYSVSDSASQTSTVVRTITISDSTLCASQWDKDTVYLANQLVNYEGNIYRAGWWTKGEQPTSSDQWGVWKLANDACQLTN